MQCEHLLVHSVCGHYCDGLCKRVHVSACLFCVGASDYHMLDVAGEAVDDVNAAQNQCPSGAVVISPAAWDMCNKRFCIAKLVGSGFAQVRQRMVVGIHS